MTNDKIRRKNLAILFKESKCRFDRDFCKIVKLVPGQYSQIKSGPKKIGDRIARKLELATKKPVGWMDEQHDEVNVTRPIIKQDRLDYDDNLVGVAMALKLLPDSIRNDIRRLIFSLAAEIQPPINNSTEHKSFRMDFKNEQHSINTQEQEDPLQSREAS